jgi:peptidyl-prolyl cis-trans isomerase D
MLNLIRQHADSWMVKTVLWLIIFAFLGTIFYSWGMGGAPGSRGGVVATVEGVEIPYSQYDKTFNNLINFYRDQFKNQFSEDLIQRLDLKTQALDALIHRKLLLLESDNLNIQVSDEELMAHIQSFPAFQKDNKYNQTYYDNYIQFNRLTHLDFEEGQREALRIEKLEKMISGNTLVSQTEALDAFKTEKETVKFDYIAFSEDHFKTAQPVTETDLNSYYDKNKVQFEVPDQIKVDYVKVNPKDFEDAITPDEEDIQEYYNSKIANFRVEKKYTASHILFQLEPTKMDEKSSDEEKQTAVEEAAKKEALEALKKIRAGADFKKLAEELSDDPSSGDNGGSLGEFPRGTMVPEFEAALEKLQPGEISEPVKSPFGYHVIKLDQKTDERIKPLTEVKDAVIQSIKVTKARQKARRVVKRIYKSTQKGSSFAEAAVEQKTEIKSSDFISRRNHAIDDVGPSPEFFNAAFALAGDQVSDPIHTFEASYILKVKERKPAYIPELDSVRKEVQEKAQKDANKKFTSSKFKGLAGKLKSGEDLKKIAKELKMDIQHTPFFSRADSIPGVGDFPEIKDKVFPLEKGQTTSATTFRKHFLIKVQDRSQAGKPTKEELETISARLKKQKSTTVFNDWLTNLRKKSNILIDQTLL